MKPSSLSLRLTIFLYLLFICSVTDASAQDISVKGRVKDNAGLPVPGAGIIIKGTNSGSVSDLDGYFTIDVPSHNSVIEVSYLGYQTVERIVGKAGFIEIILEEDAKFLDEVVVVAYGTQTKATVTGALSTIETDKLVKVPVADVTNVLAGQMPGVTTIQTTGQPGADDAQIFIRGVSSLSDGASSPLVLVDGVERPMSSIDPNEIENLSILKDASSTAVFGVRGANGVILITTKRGNTGKPKISVTSTTGVQQPISYIEKANSYEYATFWNTKMRNDNVTDQKSYFTKEAIEAYRIGSDPIMYPYKDWSKEVFNDFFIQSKNNVNISGGSEKVRYFVSLGMFYQNGILKQLPGLGYDNNYRYNRYNFRTNLDFQLSPTTTMKFNVGGIIGQSQEPRTIEGISYGWMVTKVWTVPMASPGIINGLRTTVPKSMVPLTEQLRDGYFAFYGYGYDQHYSGSINLDVDVTQQLDFITDGLSISAKGSYDAIIKLDKERAGNGMETQTVYYKSHLENNLLPTTDPDYDKIHVFVPTGTNTPLSYKESTSKDRNWYLEFRMNYNRTFDSRHTVTALLLYNQSRNYYPSGTYTYIPRSYVGFVGRVTYAYRNKYLVDVNAGYNGSENFAPGKTRFGLFPSASVGYVISEENFMKGQNVVNFLKLRFSAGKVGNDMGTTSRFMYMQSIWNPKGDYSFGTSNPTGTEYYIEGTPGNPGVTWETALKYNLGVDLTMFRERLSLTAEYFYEHRTGILISPNSTPSVIATTLPNLNIGEVDNRGYEISAGWSDSFSNSFSYDIKANVSFARNRIVYMDEIESPFWYQTQTGGATGRTTGVYKFLRLYSYDDFYYDEDGTMRLNPDLPQPNQVVAPGDAMYADLNDDGKVDGDDTMVAGYSNRPEYVFGLNGSVSYKGFTLAMNWIGATNVSKLLGIEYRIPFTNQGSRGLLKTFYDNCWTPENQSGTLPRASNVSMNWNSQTSTLWLRDASYIRLKTLTFSYRIPQNRLFRKIGVSSLDLMFTGYNLLTFSSLDFEDPESVANNSGEYPLVKTYNLGININF